MIRIRESLFTAAPDSYRANRVRSLFNIENSETETHSISVDLPIDSRPWSIGLIVGPSGSGKTTVGRRVFGEDAMHRGFVWSESAPIIEEIGPSLGFNDVATALTSVGLGSVPSWLRPYRVLSTGERFRADLARVLIEKPQRVVLDEFTSVVDRQIAKVGSAAFANAWRRGSSGQVVILSCHRDIIDWLQPDWTLDTRDWQFGWRSLQRRPSINLELFRTDWDTWRIFKAHHYLNAGQMMAAFPYLGVVDGEPVAFCAVTTQVGMKSARIARIVVMPEWQGVGIGLRFVNTVARDWLRGNNRYGLPLRSRVSTSHPGLIASMVRHPSWDFVSSRLLGAPVNDVHRQSRQFGIYGGHFRATATFEYAREHDPGL